jgi:MFS transporter, BCD family, chlorophyll transporter
VPATIVAAMIAIPLLVAPFRALIGFKSDTYRNVLGWRRVPFIWFGTLAMFGGLAIMPFALIVLSGEQAWGGRWIALAGLRWRSSSSAPARTRCRPAASRLATDLASEDKRPRVVALMYVMMLVGALASAFILGGLLRDFNSIKLIQVIQGAALFTLVVNTISLWKQEARRRGVVPYAKGERRPMFREAWRTFVAGGNAIRLLVATGLGFFAFNMQDVLLEPYGGEILHWSVGQTTSLTGIAAAGAIIAFLMAARMLERGSDAIRIAALGCAIGVVSFAAVIFASPLQSSVMFASGTFLMGMGEGLFAVGTLTAAMGLRDATQHGIALGAWGAVYATAEGLSMAAPASSVTRWSGHRRRTHHGPAGRSERAVQRGLPYRDVVVVRTLVALGPLVRLVRAGAIRAGEWEGLRAGGVASLALQDRRNVGTVGMVS